MTKKRILAVDDEPEIINILKLRLEANKYEVITAGNGEEALKKAREERPDLIVLDVMIPPPNGFQVCRTLKDDPEHKKIPIILLTAKASDSDKFWGTESGADAYVTKPYNADDLMEKIKMLVSE